METSASRKIERRSLALYECGPLRFANAGDIYYQRVGLDHAVSLEKADDRERLEA
jgi:hypothetical protein